MPSGKSDTTSAEKMLALYTLLLLSSRAWSLGALAEELQCSKPTVIRLLRKIERFEGVTIYSGQRSTAGRPEKYFGLERTPADIERSRMRIHTEELRLLHLCREVALPLLPATLGKGLLDILRRTSTLVPKSEEWREPDMPFLRTATLGGIDYAPQQQILQTLLKAIEKRCVCEIVYTAQDKPQRTHEMAVTSLYSGHHALYARGWKVQEKGRADPVHPLFLAVHRINSVIITRRTHTTTDIKDKGHFGIIEGEPFQVRVWFSRELEVYIRERHFSEYQHIEAANEGIILTFTAHSDMEVVAWVLGFGRKAKALDPPWLVERVKSEIEGMGYMYAQA